MPEPLETILRGGDEGQAWAAASLVPDEFVEHFAWAGAADQVAAQVTSVVDAGARQITILPSPAEDFMPTVRAFGQRVILPIPGS